MEKAVNFDYHKLITKFLSYLKITDNERLVQLKLWLDSDPANRRIFDEENEGLWRETSVHIKQDYFKPDTAMGENFFEAWIINRTSVGSIKQSKLQGC